MTAAVAACTAVAPSPPSVASGAPTTASLRVYTSVTQATVDAVVAAFDVTYPDLTVEVFRAPTGELNARIAAERREGRLRADVLWLTDPLSMQPYASEGLLAVWTPAESSAVGDGLHTDVSWGTRILSMVLVRPRGAVGPVDWGDLTQPAYRDAVAIPDPGFAGSAFGALGYLGLNEAYGIEYYRRLNANGAIQVRSPDDVVTGVAEGRLKAGMTLDSSARTAVTKGSPIELVWPLSGAIAMYSPIAIVKDSAAPGPARSFADFVLTKEAQE
ncbi:MAG: extracellular solute-binding protein, partial [Chloroflexi bacterium]|nr:extracellular solute-binding protein [Chloroflexota bacterium]